MIRTAIAALTLCLTASAAFADVTGRYTAEGRNPNGSTYTGTVRMIEDGGRVMVSWQVGNQSYTGTGPINGHVITVDWGDAHPVYYLIMPDGELHGIWADGKGLEKLTPQ